LITCCVTPVAARTRTTWLRGREKIFSIVSVPYCMVCRRCLYDTQKISMYTHTQRERERMLKCYKLLGEQINLVFLSLINFHKFITSNEKWICAIKEENRRLTPVNHQHWLQNYNYAKKVLVCKDKFTELIYIPVMLFLKLSKMWFRSNLNDSTLKKLTSLFDVPFWYWMVENKNFILRLIENNSL